MKSQETMQAHQLERFAHFLEEHPDFSPLLMGEGAAVYGFRVGNSYLGVAALEKIIGTMPAFNAEQAEMLLAPLSPRAREP